MTNTARILLLSLLFLQLVLLLKLVLSLITYTPCHPTGVAKPSSDVPVIQYLAFSATVGTLLPQQKAVNAKPNIWHARLGHPRVASYDLLKSLLSLPNFHHDEFTICPTCSIAKGVVKKSALSTKTYTSPLHMLQIDLSGGFWYKEYTSQKFFMIIHDAYCRYYTMNHLKSK